MALFALYQRNLKTAFRCHFENTPNVSCLHKNPGRNVFFFRQSHTFLFCLKNIFKFKLFSFQERPTSVPLYKTVMVCIPLYFSAFLNIYAYSNASQRALSESELQLVPWYLLQSKAKYHLLESTTLAPRALASNWQVKGQSIFYFVRDHLRSGVENNAWSARQGIRSCTENRRVPSGFWTFLGFKPRTRWLHIKIHNGHHTKGKIIFWSFFDLMWEPAVW